MNEQVKKFCKKYGWDYSEKLVELTKENTNIGLPFEDAIEDAYITINEK